MRIKVKTQEMNLNLRVPTMAAGLVIRVIPESAFISMRKRMRPPYNQLVTRENAKALYGACKEIFKKNKGLEIVHVEGSDGTLVSIKL